MSSIKNTPVDPEIREVFSRFFDGTPAYADIIDTGTGEDDFRNTVMITDTEGEKYVIKIVDNGFTFPERIRMWQRTAVEYRDLGYYCPQILCGKRGDFPAVEYRGRKCVAYAEEFSKYAPLEDRAAEGGEADSSAYFADIWSMTAKIAAKKLDYTEYPSGYCLFETFSPEEECDEVMDNALEWKKTADALPDEFHGQTERVWRLWNDNREKLKAIYPKLPTSVFQADLNPTNLLIGENGEFKGVYDFNLCGRDVFLNYLMRENYDGFEKELELIRAALRVASAYYEFSDEEKAAAPLLYRCIKPLWYNRVEELKKAGNETEKIRRCLDRTEHYLTADIDLTSCMENNVGNEMEKLLDEFTVRSKEILRDSLVGVYLHGSSVMGCFNPEKSDLDIIVVVSRPVSDDAKREFMKMVVDISARGPKKGIEMSIVLREVCMPFVYPTPYELHFSIGHLEKYQRDPEAYIRDMNGVDWDLAAHFTVIRARGRSLFGAPIEEIFAEVPKEDYMDSIRNDVCDAAEEIEEYPLYLTLNLARVLGYSEDGLVLSKKEGAEWALGHIPEEYHPLVREALREYEGSGEGAYDIPLAKRYARYMLERIGIGEE